MTGRARAIMPPGRSTRRASPTNADSGLKCWADSNASTLSTEPSRRGMPAADAFALSAAGRRSEPRSCPRLVLTHTMRRGRCASHHAAAGDP